MNSSKRDEDKEAGISLGLAFIFIGLFLQFIFWGNDIFVWVSTITIGLGIAGIGIEFEKEEYGKGGSNFGVGVFILMIGFLGSMYFEKTIIILFFSIFVFFGLFGVIKGYMEFQQVKDNIKEKRKESLLKNVNTIGSILGFLSSITTIIVNFLN